ncbi:MAG: hypothetical protein GX601_14715 [Anaerolineales bacterium]|nr:hypothetical protein [Anaerolineales bacterium]
MRTLLGAQRDFHLADEMLMEPGAPAEARVVADESGARLVVGRMTYRVVIVPPGVTLMANTVRLLREFAQAGGQVLGMEPRPELVDGRISAGLAIPADCRSVDLDSVLQTLDEVLPFDVHVTGPGVIWSHHRRIDDVDVYFLVNTDLEASGQASVELRGRGNLEAWAPATGDVQPLAVRQDEDVTAVSLDFPPVGSHLLVRRAGDACTPHASRLDRLIAEIPIVGPWQLTLDGPNAIILDRAQVRAGNDGRWSQPLSILEAHAAIADYGSGAPFALRSVFEVSVCPAGPTYLVVEWPNSLEIEVNGTAVPASGTSKWWKDISFRTIDISTVVRAGRNEVIIRGVFNKGVELETMYVVGSFGVEIARLGHENRYNGQVFDRYGASFSLIEPPTQIRSAERRDGLAVDLTAAGMPFFAGRASLAQEIEIPAMAERAVVSIGNLRAALAHVWLNGERLGAAVWPPHEVDVTHQLRKGHNTLGIELVGTLRNLLGPHHLNKGDLDGTSPESFHDRVRWTDDHILVPFGFDEVTLRLFAAA